METNIAAATGLLVASMPIDNGFDDGEGTDTLTLRPLQKGEPHPVS